MAARDATWLVVGASRGIGLEFVRRLASADGVARVHATYRSAVPEGFDASRIVWHRVDVTSSEDVGALAVAVDRWDILVHNAGVKSDSRDEMRRVNAEAPFDVVSALLPTAAPSGARVVLIGSQLGSRERFGGGKTPRDGYGASKCALNDAYRAAAGEWTDRGVASCVVHPGWVSTDMGGPSAPVTPAQSVAGMLALIERLSCESEDTCGAFLTYEGKRHPW